jgi:nucleoid DNA-binding protein
MEGQAMSRISIQEFAERLAEKKGMSVSDAQQFLTAMLDTINEGLKDDKTVKVKGLGTFKVIDVKQRKSVDVNTGEEIIIEGRGKITFTPDSIMKDLVNKPFSQFETVVLNEGVDFSEIDSMEGEDEEPTDDVEITENEEQHEEIIETKADEVPPIAAIMGSEVPEIEPETGEEVSNDAPEAVSDESFSEALLVLDYINGKEMPQETPAEEPEEEGLDATDEAIADALFVVHSLDEEKAEKVEAPVETIEETEEAPEAVVVELVDETTEEIPDEVTEEPSITEKPEPVAEELEEPVKEDIVEEEEKPESVETPTEQIYDNSDDEEPSSTWKRWLIAIALIAVVGLLSYYCINFFNHKESFANEELNNNALAVDSQKVANEHPADSVAAVDSLAIMKREKEIEDSITAVAMKNKAEGAKKETVAKPEQKPVDVTPAPNKPQPAAPTTNKELEYAKRLVQYGAYNIVGTDKVITVKKGQTMTSVAKAYLGRDMACYIEVHNGTTTLIEGQKLKIPKLQTKKKSRR